MIPTTIVTGGEGVKITEVSPGYPAAEAGIQAGDVVLDIAGSDVQTPTDVNKIIKERQGVATIIKIQRNDEIIDITLTPGTGDRPLGVELYWLKEHTTIYRLGFFKAISASAHIIISIPTIFPELVSAIIQNPADTLMGPIGAAQMTGEMIKYGASAVISSAGSISMGLALFNLLPIPPLDGAGMLLAIIEILRRGKRLSLQKEQLIYKSGTLLLIILTIVIWYNDIVRLVRG